MTSVLSLSPHLSLTIPYRERAFERSWSSLGSGNSTGTVQYLQLRRVSTSSVISGASLYANSWQGIPDHTPPHRNSAIGLPTRRSPSARKSDSSSSSHARSASAVPFSLTRTSDLSIANLRGLRFSSNSAPAPEQDGKTLDFVYEEDSLSEEVVWHDPLEEQEQEQEQEVEQTLPLVVDQIFKRPIIDDVHDHSFRRWMSTIRKRKRTNRRLLPADVPPVVIEASSPPKSAQQTPHRFLPGHRKSDSLVSSLGFVTAVKSASITIASTSMASFSRYTHTKSPRSRRFANNSANSGSDVVRKSIDSVAAMDEAAMKRSRRRREKVEELIRTEEGYLNDLKALCNAYFTLLSPNASLDAQAKTATRRNLNSLVQLHEELLRSLHAVVPFSEHFLSGPEPLATHHRSPRHVRWHSADAASLRFKPAEIPQPVRKYRRSLDMSRSSDQESGPVYCSPQTTADVAKVFGAKMKSLRLYEEYGARYRVLSADIDHTQIYLASGHDYDRGVEKLNASLNPVSSRDAQLKKALGLKDLLIKPIQRITRYELLFRDLCKFTHSSDDPTSHAILDEILFLLSQTCHNVNEAKDNPEKLAIMESQRLLEDRLLLRDQPFPSRTLDAFGRLSLCGTLYIAYRARDGCKGQYAICVLYEAALVLAVSETASKYRVLAVITLATSAIEEADNGKGLQCHTTPNTWKLLFDDSGKIYELLLVACSSIETIAWRDQISGRIAVEAQHVAEGHGVPLDIHSPLVEDVRSIGNTYGKAGDFTGRMPVHRTATLGPKAEINQVIIRNTQAAKDSFENPSTSSLPMPRSQSVTTPRNIPDLMARRNDRIHLEQVLADIWTRYALPYPGLGSRRAEYNFRASANSVIRKLSIASIASNISKRSMSYASISQSSIHEAKPPPKRPKPMSRSTAPCGSAMSQGRKPLVDFHNAPLAFLPEDFELKDPTKKPSKFGGGLRALTMTMDRPRSPFFAAAENKVPEVKRAKSVRHETTNDMPHLRSVIPSAPRAPPRQREDRKQSAPPKKDKDAVPTVAKRAKAKLLKTFLG